MHNTSTLDSDGRQNKGFRLEAKNPGNNHLFNRIAIYKVTLCS